MAEPQSDVQWPAGQSPAEREDAVRANTGLLATGFIGTMLVLGAVTVFFLSENGTIDPAGWVLLTVGLVLIALRFVLTAVRRRIASRTENDWAKVSDLWSTAVISAILTFGVGLAALGVAYLLDLPEGTRMLVLAGGMFVGLLPATLPIYRHLLTQSAAARRDAAAGDGPAAGSDDDAHS